MSNIFLLKYKNSLLYFSHCWLDKRGNLKTLIWCFVEHLFTFLWWCRSVDFKLMRKLTHSPLLLILIQHFNTAAAVCILRVRQTHHHLYLLTIQFIRFTSSDYFDYQFMFWVIFQDPKSQIFTGLASEIWRFASFLASLWKSLGFGLLNFT